DPLADPSSFPTAVLPSAALVAIALVMGHLLYRRGMRLAPLTAAGFALVMVSVWAGIRWPLLGLERAAWPEHGGWVTILLAYSFIASVLPVWSLLQARDFLNSLLLYLGLALCYLGLFVSRPEFAAPAFRPHPEGAPSFYPFVFIIVACGAASGFHSLVSSGTTAKQIAREGDARAIGYGGMLGESLLGLLAVLACTAGLVGGGGVTPGRLWQETYADWGAMQALGSTIGVFVAGAAHFIESLGVADHRTATAFVAVIVVSFALTTLDSATRLLRFNISEMGESLGWRWLGDRYAASGLAVAVIAFFAFYEVGGRPAGLALWQLFGTVNQLLAGLALLVVTLYLYRRRRNYWVTALPMFFMMASTLAAMLVNLRVFLGQWAAGGAILFVVGSILLVLAVWLAVEAVAALRRLRRQRRVEDLEIA
ncbi:MAG: carbon starvation protein A, partial [Acidobacteriota bacterium]|nr:carbon starvation protein A [Acidobacteriota bacterium]